MGAQCTLITDPVPNVATDPGGVALAVNVNGMAVGENRRIVLVALNNVLLVKGLSAPIAWCFTDREIATIAAVALKVNRH